MLKKKKKNINKSIIKQIKLNLKKPPLRTYKVMEQIFSPPSYK